MSNIDDSTLHAARLFADKYGGASSEKQLGQSFWRDFFTSVAGVSDLLSSGIEFEFPVRSKSGTINFIDVFWSGVVLIEQKSAGKSLDEAEKQARDYLIALQAEQRPPTIIVSDFKRIRIIEVLAGQSHEFELKDLPENLARMEMVVGQNAKEATRQEVTADQKAVELMADFYVEFEKAGYEGHEVSVFLVRILFLNFGDDTRMWKQIPGGLFRTYCEATAPDGSGVGGRLQELFQTLDTPTDKRPTTLSPGLIEFPYINGGLFREQLPIFSFTPSMRDALVKTTEYDWSTISPAIFGAMFQTVKSKEDRRHLGEHYTSVENILKVIRPLFLDEFQERLMKSWDSVPALKKFHKELSEYNFLDPACGSGNFLLVTFKLLREIELRLIARIKELEGDQGQLYLDGRLGLSINLKQFHGIEINEWSSQIATVAMYLAEHKANQALEEITGFAPNIFPLEETANIINANALRIEWSEVAPINDKTFIFGNPPFIGQQLQDVEQKKDTFSVWSGNKKTGMMDFVSNWFLIAARQVASHGGECGFVSTNSITQGEQVQVLWGEFSKLGIVFNFAHRTFSWTNEASGKAAVHVVVIGFSPKSLEHKTKKLWSYKDIKGQGELRIVSELSPYLIEGSPVAVTSRKSALSPELPNMVRGNQPSDGSHLAKISPEEAEEIRRSDPIASKYLRRLIGSTEMINGEERYCLWLEDASPSDLRASKVLSSRVSAVKEFRLSSPASVTRKNADNPHLFQQRTQPKSEQFIAVPCVSSDSRRYVPIGFYPGDWVTNNAVLVVPDAPNYVFALLNSSAFNVWNRTVSGRLKSDTRISQEITYFNFPVPVLSDTQKMELDECAQAILSARAEFLEKGSSLADLYSPVSMPLELTKAHEKNDRVIAKVFGYSPQDGDSEILTRLFSLYEELNQGLIPAKKS